MCNYETGKFLDYTTKTVTMSKKFCTIFTDLFTATLHTKYYGLFRLMLTIDDISLVMMGKRLIPNDSDRYNLRRLVAMTHKCKESPSFENCKYMCYEFNMNKTSWLFDGESKVIETFLVLIHR